MRKGLGDRRSEACALIAALLIGGCVLPLDAATPAEPAAGSGPPRDRLSAIPAEASKITPQDDPNPPILHADEWQAPVPIAGAVNTAGAEDAAFVTPDGSRLLFFFTPDVRVPVERQIADGVTGIYLARLEGGNWGEPERLLLQDPGELALDGCPFLQGETLWFCSARKGNYRGVDLWRATLHGGRASNWMNAGERLNLEYGVGEMHITADGQALYYHSDREGGQGGFDIWVSPLEGGEWGEPIDVQAVNTQAMEGWPFITQDGRELWFTRTYQGTPAVFRSLQVDGGWSEPQLILSQFAGEPSLDAAGNIYFTHHYFREGTMLEADIYVAYRK